MAIVQISKIQVRTGAHSDLPQLDIGELGFATDTKTVHIGNDPVLDPPVGIEPTLTQLLTNSPDCSINASQINGVLTIPVENLKVTGGTNGYVLQTNGEGTLSWAAGSGGGGGGGGTNPGGSDTQIQFNDNGVFGGDTGLTFDKTSNALTVSGNVSATNITGTLLTAVQTNITRVGTLANLTTAANGNINLGGELKITNNNLHGGSDYAGMITLTTTVSGASNTSKFIRLNKTGGLEILNNAYSTTIFTLTDSGNVLTAAGGYFVGDGRYLTNINATSVSTLSHLIVDGITNLGPVGNLVLTGGTSGQVLITDGAGSLSWATVSGNGAPFGNANIATYLPAYTGNVAKAVYAYSVDGPNVSGIVDNANYSAYAGNVTIAAQPSITSLGRLITLTVGNLTANTQFGNGIINASGNITGARFYGNAVGLTNILGNAVVGNVTNATYATSAGSAGYATIANAFAANAITWSSVSDRPTRKSLTVTTGLLGNANVANANINAYCSGYALYGIQSNANAWITIYSSANSRISDASRTSTTDPTPGSGVIAEVITTDANTIYFTPAVIGFNTDSPVTSNIYLKIQNLSGANATIGATLTVLPMEY